MKVQLGLLRGFTVFEVLNIMDPLVIPKMALNVSGSMKMSLHNAQNTDHISSVHPSRVPKPRVAL